MKRLMLSVALLLSASPALLASAPAGAVRQSDAQAEYDALNKEYRAARSAFSKQLRELRKAEDEAAIAEARKEDPTEKFLARFVEASTKYVGLDEALPFLRWIVQNAPVTRTETETVVAAEAQAALDTILRDHIASEEVEWLASRLSWMASTFGNERCRSTLDAIIGKSPHASVKLAARYSRAEITLRNSDSTKAQRGTAAEDLNAFIAESDSKDKVARAEGMLFELENLQIGHVAPEIEAADLDGVVFKLSDYRGKVVVIDFWGDW